MTDEETLRVAQALGTIRCGASAAEEELHAQVAQALGAAGIGAAHEVRLAPLGFVISMATPRAFNFSWR